MHTKIYITFLLLLVFHTASYCQKGYLPDNNFEQALIDLGYDTAPLDDSVTISDVEGILELDIVALGIADLTGIKYFEALTRLDCSLNALTVLDFTNNVNLEELNCELNGLYSLNITENSALKRLSFGYNELSTIDLSNNFLLEELSFVGNSITTINLLENSELLKLVCTGNPITSLNLIGNPNLEWLECSATSLTTLDILSNGSLKTLICSANGLTNIDLTNAVELITLNCEANELNEVDVSNSPLLEKAYVGFNHIGDLNFVSNDILKVVDVRNNELTSLDIRNGANPIIETFRATGNEMLTCINVDNVAWSDDNWTEVDEDAYFSLDCNLALPELNMDFDVYPNPTTNQVYIDMSTLTGSYVITLMDLSGQYMFNKTEVSGAIHEIEMSDLASGIYFLSISNGVDFKVVKIVKR